MDHESDRESSDSDSRVLIDAARDAANQLTAVLTDSRLLPNAIPGYKVVREVRRGGQGVVYRAIQDKTARTVAIKIMHEGPFAGSHGRARFEREVRLLARIKHPNIVTIHESGTASGSHYFVMDWVAGQPLDTYALGRNSSVREALELFRKICEAVNAAHLRGIIHRDLKPSNILIDADGEPHVLDFGLAKIDSDEMGDATHWRSMTVTGQFVGSLPWASPEQAEGLPDQIDLRTDVYSLGVVLYQVLTGKFPYPVMGKMREALSNILDAEPAKPSTIRKDINDEVETIIMKCLAKEPYRRYQSAGELARDIRCYLSGAPIEAKRESTLYVLRKQMRRHRIPLVVATGVLLLIIASSVVAWTLYGQARRNLWTSYLSEARAIRATDTPGRRYDALEALGRAAAIRSSTELRNEAIAAMTLTDLRVERRVQIAFHEQQSFGFAPCGERKLYYSWDRMSGQRSVKSVDDDQTLLTLPDARPGVTTAYPRFSRDGRFIACVTESACEIWDIDAGRQVKRIAATVSAGGHPLDFSPDAREFAWCTPDGSIHIVDLTTDASRKLPPLHGPVFFLRYDPTGRYLATNTLQDEEVLVRDVRTGDLLQTLEHPGRVWRTAWSADGRQLAVGCDSGHVVVWDALTGISRSTLRGHFSAADHVGFDRSGNLLFSISWDGTTRIWDPRVGTPLLTIPAMTAEHFEAETNRLVFTSGKTNVDYIVATVDHGKVLGRMVGPPADTSTDRSYLLNISSDGRWLASGSQGGVRIWDLIRGQQVADLPTNASGFVLFQPDDSALLTAGGGRVLRWPIAAGPKSVSVGPPTTLLQRSNARLFRGRFRPDGASLVVADNRHGRVIVVDVNGSGTPREIGPHGGMANVSMSPDGKWLATGAWRGTGVRIWDFASGELIQEIPTAGNANVSFSPDGKWLVTSEADHVIRRVGTWAEAWRFPRRIYASVPGHIAFSPAGDLLVVQDGGPPFVFVLVNLKRFERIASLPLPADAGTLGSVAFTPDGTRLVFADGHAGHIVPYWDLRELRNQLAQMNLDWDRPPYPPAPSMDEPELLRLEVDLGELAPPSAEEATQE